MHHIHNSVASISSYIYEIPVKIPQQFKLAMSNRTQQEMSGHNLQSLKKYETITSITCGSD
jgi:hypothetical protein